MKKSCNNCALRFECSMAKEVMSSPEAVQRYFFQGIGCHKTMKEAFGKYEPLTKNDHPYIYQNLYSFNNN